MFSVHYREPLDVNWVYSCYSLPSELVITEPCKLVLCRIDVCMSIKAAVLWHEGTWIGLINCTYWKGC